MCQRRRDQGAALASMLMVGALLLLVALAVASVSLHSLHVAQGIHDGAQGELLARAAAEQFASEFRGTAATGSAVQSGGGTDFLERYRRAPVFPDGGEHLGGEVSITFDPGLPYHSVDNSQSERSAASWADRGTGRTSVPPFSVSLVVNVKVGQSTTHYEAILQKRWPYAATSREVMTLTGKPRPAGPTQPAEPGRATTKVRGNVFLTAVDPIPDKTPSAASFTLRPPVPGAPAQVLVPVSFEMFQALKQSDQQASAWSSNIAIGSPKAYGLSVASTGNELRGRADFQGNPGEVTCFEGNIWGGDKRLDVMDPNELLRLGDKIFKTPEPWDFADASGGMEPIWEEDPDVQAQLPPHLRGRPKFLLLTSDLELKGPSSDGDLSYSDQARYRLPTSAGNRYYDLWQDEATGDVFYASRRATGKSLTLKDCMLYVDGNLDLSAEYAEGDDAVRDIPGSSPTPLPGLRGSNATLIVNGSLVLTNGVLDARDRGMVIYCQRLVMEARGHYRGLILVEESAVLYPPINGGSERFVVEGAIICGGKPFSVVEFREDLLKPRPLPSPMPGASPSPGAAPSPSPTAEASPEPPPLPPGTHEVQGLRMWTTDLKYDPRYLKGLNQFGDFHLIALRRIQ